MLLESTGIWWEAARDAVDTLQCPGHPGMACPECLVVPGVWAPPGAPLQVQVLMQQLGRARDSASLTQLVRDHASSSEASRSPAVACCAIASSTGLGAALGGDQKAGQ